MLGLVVDSMVASAAEAAVTATSMTHALALALATDGTVPVMQQVARPSTAQPQGRALSMADFPERAEMDPTTAQACTRCREELLLFTYLEPALGGSF